MKQIATIAGVSRGTVDRVIHNRTGVSPEVRDRIQKIIDDLEYHPNIAAVTLKGLEKQIQIGIVVPDLKNEFFISVYKGILAAKKRYQSYGVQFELYMMHSSTSEELLAGINDILSKGANGIAFSAINSVKIEERIAQLPKGYPIVTFNSDLDCGKRLCFVGQEAYGAGCVAGHMMTMQLRGYGKIALTLGSMAISAQKLRAQGFLSVVGKQTPELPMLGPIEIGETEDQAYAAVKRILQQEPELIGIYAAGGGQKSIADALSDSGRADNVVMIGHDLLPKTVEYLKSGVVNCSIGQEPYIQGYLPIEILTEYLLYNKIPKKRKLYTNIDIRIKENAEYLESQNFKEYNFSGG